MLVSQLWELLTEHGFRLIKWYSKAREVLVTIRESERAVELGLGEIGYGNRSSS